MKHIRICSVLLALILAFSSLPLSVIAENTISFHDKNQVILDQNFTTETTDESDNVFIVQEDTTKRGEFEKHYICSNGTYVVASYAEAIHYKDDNGEWADVDNRPVQTAKGDYTTRNGDFGISVPSSTGDGHLMRMDKGEHSLSWTLSANKKTGTIKMDSNVSAMAQRPIQSQKMQVGATKRPEIIVSNTEQPLENHKILRDEATFELPNVSGKVRYDDLFGADEGVSVVYTTYRNKIEEDIYIEKPTDITSFSMEVAAPDLTPRLNADNSVDFLDNDGKMCYHVGIPYMMDADFAVLNDIETTVIRSGDIWVITYTPDAEWFTSEERVYPILLDPSITTNEYRTNMQDTYVEEGDNTVHSSEQLLYINGGTGNRKAVIRFLTLPAIDDTMPLISASLTLYSQYSPFSDVFLKLSYSRDNISTSIGSYTYEKAINAGSLYTCYSTLMTGSTVAFFDLTNCIYDMYESGTDDLILGYSNDNDTTYCYPFHSVETTTSYKPTLKIYYGYSLPTDKIGDGKIISIQNYGSLDYMTATPNEGSNIYQLENDDWIPTSYQKFRLEKVSATGGYRLYPYTSSNKVVGVQPTSGYVQGTKNVALYNVGETNTQEWLFVPVSYYEFRIVSRTNMTKCLSAYNDDNGSPTTTTTTASGNIYSKTIEDGSEYQLWWLYDEDNEEISLDNSPANIANGIYYITNRYTGRYLYGNGNDGSSVVDYRGLKANLGETNVGWRITNLNDGYCTIQSLSGMYYLGYRKNANGDNVILSSLPQGITDYFKWDITIATGGGLRIQNKKNSKYLSSGNLSAEVSTTEFQGSTATASASYSAQVWRVVEKTDYCEVESLSVSDCLLGVNKTILPQINDTNSHFENPEDFIYNTNTDEFVEIDESGLITGKKVGITSISITHKTTGINTSFNVETNKTAIIIIPGFMGSELSFGNRVVWPVNSGVIMEDGIDTAEGLHIAENVSYLMCDQYGESEYQIQPYNNDNFGALDTYDDLYIDLQGKYNATYYDITFFAYDWRMPSNASATSLNNFIAARQYESVILIAHSMGGLVVSSYLTQWQSSQTIVEKTIFIGTPFEGSVQAADLLINHNAKSVITEFLDIPLVNWEKIAADLLLPLKDVLGNCPSLYEMMPTQRYIEEYQKKYLIINTNYINNETCQLYNVVNAYYTKWLVNFNTGLMANAHAFHNSLYVNGEHISQSVDSYYIVGYNISTEMQLTYDSMSATATETMEGDGVVPLYSANLNGQYGQNTYYASNLGHTSLVKADDTLLMISNIIDGCPENLPDGISKDYNIGGV